MGNCQVRNGPFVPLGCGRKLGRCRVVIPGLMDDTEKPQVSTETMKALWSVVDLCWALSSTFSCHLETPPCHSTLFGNSTIKFCMKFSWFFYCHPTWLLHLAAENRWVQSAKHFQLWWGAWHEIFSGKVGGAWIEADAPDEWLVADSIIFFCITCDWFIASLRFSYRCQVGL